MPQSKITYIGLYNDPVLKAISDRGTFIDKQYAILAGKFRRYHGIGLLRHAIDVKTNLKNARDLIFFIIGFLQSLIIFLFSRPDVLFVKGGFVGLPVGLAAAFLRIPIVTHDSDSIPGLTNKLLSKYAKLQAVGMPIEFYKNIYKISKLRYTGIPIRSDFMTELPKKEARQKYNLGVDDRVIAVIGGSLGAARLNEYVYQNLNLFIENELKIIWVTGSTTFKHYDYKIKSHGYDKHCHILNFTNNMPGILTAADLVISRAGATAIAELAIKSKPAIIVPNPILAGGHQTKNALNLSDKKAVYVLNENELNINPALLGKTVIEIINDKKLKNLLAANIQRLAVKNANQKIVDVIKEVLVDR